MVHSDNLIIHQGIVYKQHICYYRFEIVIIGLKLLLTVIIIKEEHYEPYKICYCHL